MILAVLFIQERIYAENTYPYLIIIVSEYISYILPGWYVCKVVPGIYTGKYTLTRCTYFIPNTFFMEGGVDSFMRLINFLRYKFLY